MKRDYILKYSQEASKDGEWAGDIEIATASILFNTKINMYTLNVNGYEFYNKYNPEDNMNGGVRDTVNILYINENHFNLLIPNDNNIINSNNNIIQKGINFKEFKNLILNAQSQLKRKIDKKLNLKFKSKSVYVDYPITSRKDYYNEIFKYINDNKIMPKRLEYSVNKNRKTVEKKRGKFRKLVREKYRILNNRLQYFYYYKNKNLWLNIIYQEEKIPLLKFIHFNNNHIKRESMETKVIEMGFYWYGYSNDIINFIDNCGVCHAEKYGKKIPLNPKIIITYGPHIRYQCDLWYLPEILRINTEYLYCLDIIDHYSKWLNSFLLKNKNADLVVSKIKSYIRSNGNCEIFQTDNGKEFNNNLLKTFLENNNIKYLRSSPYHPPSNGCCEAVHKEVKSYLLRAKNLYKDKFNIEISIEDAIDFHNNRILKSTGYKPIELRNNNDKTIIKEVVENVIKSMKRKIKNNFKLKKNTMLLISNDIEKKSNRY